MGFSSPVESVWNASIGVSRSLCSIQKWWVSPGSLPAGRPNGTR